MRMTQCITTKYLGPTTFRGARIVAKCKAGTYTHTIAGGTAVDGSDHVAAARGLIRSLGWDDRTYYGEWHGGALANGEGFAFVMVGGDDTLVK